MNFRLPYGPALSRAGLLLAVALLSHLSPASTARAQGILIIRPQHNNSSEAEQSQIDFELRISAFTPLVSVKINGVQQPIPKTLLVEVSAFLRLYPGENKIEVEATTEFETVTKIFTIQFGPTEAPAPQYKTEFAMFAVMGLQFVSNPLGLPDSFSAPSGLRKFVALIPRWDWIRSSDERLSLQSIISRDQYGKQELKSEEVAFTQIRISMISALEKGQFLTLGGGYNRIDLGFAAALTGKQPAQRDYFVFSSLRFGLQAPAELIDLTLEFKRRAFRRAVTDSDRDENGFVITFRGELRAELFAFKSRTKVSFATLDAKGKLKDKFETRLSEELSRPFGNLLLGFGLRLRRNAFLAEDAQFGGRTPTENLLTYFVNGGYPLSRSWILGAEFLYQSQDSNVPESQYRNMALSTSAIYVF
ncbi:MAG: hypothetical protein O7A69_04745 [SAR324 cluster bacterium]|nr:hypothetical protein [SAR324 cluster bacterium]